MSKENMNIKKPQTEIEEPPEVKEFFELIGKAEDYRNKVRAARRQEAQGNVKKFREATRDYLKAVEGMKLPECYVKTLAHYAEVLNMYYLEQKMGLCRDCDFNIGSIAPYFVTPGPQGEAELQRTELEAAASEEKKVNIYAPEPEKAAAAVQKDVESTETGGVKEGVNKFE